MYIVDGEQKKKELVLDKLERELFKLFKLIDRVDKEGDAPRSSSYGVYISQLIRFARVCSNIDDYNNRNLFLTAKLIKSRFIDIIKIRKACSKFYHRHSELIVKYNIGLKLFCNKAYQNLYFMVI